MRKHLADQPSGAKRPPKDEIATTRGPTIAISTDGADPIVRKFTPPESQIPPRRRLTHDELIDAVAKHRRKRIRLVREHRPENT